MPKFYFSNHEIPIPCVWGGGGGVVYYMTTNYNYFQSFEDNIKNNFV